MKMTEINLDFKASLLFKRRVVNALSVAWAAIISVKIMEMNIRGVVLITVKARESPILAQSASRLISHGKTLPEGAH